MEREIRLTPQRRQQFRLCEHQVQPVEATGVYEDLRAEVQPLYARHVLDLVRRFVVLRNRRFAILHRVTVRQPTPLQRNVTIRLRLGAHRHRYPFLIRRHPRQGRVSFRTPRGRLETPADHTPTNSAGDLISAR